jgi:hypothetical protein
MIFVIQLERASSVPDSFPLFDPANHVAAQESRTTTIQIPTHAIGRAIESVYSFYLRHIRIICVTSGS